MSLDVSLEHHPHTWFYSSIEALLDLARQEADADGYAFYEFDQSGGRFTPRVLRGMPARVLNSFPTKVSDRPMRLASPADHPLAIMTYPLRGHHGLAGTVEFAFAEPVNPHPNYRTTLQHAADAVERLLQAAGSSTALVSLTTRISELEARLADIKIRERALGLLHRDTGYSRTEALSSHVSGMLQLSELEELLSARLRQAEDRLAERRTVSEAKAVLQRLHGLSEEESYVRLREASRRSRTKLSEVAANVIAHGGLYPHHRLTA